VPLVGNGERPTLAWHFTITQARRKLRHLYRPLLSCSFQTP
jgi:hypothetical protein